MRGAWLVPFIVSSIHQFRQAISHLMSLARSIPSVHIVSNEFEEVRMRVSSESVILTYVGLSDVIPGESANLKWWRLSPSLSTIYTVRFPPVPALMPPADLAFFANCAARSLIDVLRIFDDPEFAVIDPTDKGPFFIVYRRRLTLVLSIRPLGVGTMAVSQVYPNRCIFSWIWSLANNPPSIPAKRVSLLSLPLAKLPLVKTRIIEIAEIIDVLETEGFRFRHTDEYHRVCFTQRISFVDMGVILEDGKLQFESGLQTEHADIMLVLQKIADMAGDLKECITGVTNLIRVFLPVDVELLRLVLAMLEKLTEEFTLNISVMCAVMQTAMIEDNGNASIAVYLDDEMIGIQFLEPFGQMGRFLVRRNNDMQSVVGVPNLIALLKVSG
jgi:hypothetical protein